MEDIKKGDIVLRVYKHNILGLIYKKYEVKRITKKWIIIELKIKYKDKFKIITELKYNKNGVSIEGDEIIEKVDDTTIDKLNLTNAKFKIKNKFNEITKILLNY